MIEVLLGLICMLILANWDVIYLFIFCLFSINNLIPFIFPTPPAPLTLPESLGLQSHRQIELESIQLLLSCMTLCG